MAISYDWDIEEVDEHGDVLDHDHMDELTRADMDRVDGVRQQLVLIKDVIDHFGDLDTRAWAYAERNAAGRWVHVVEVADA